MLYNALLSLTAFMFCLSLFLVHRASVLENDFRKLQGDIMLQLNQPRSEGVNGKMAKMSKTREPSVFQKAQSSLKISSRRVKREQNSCRGGLQLRTENVSIRNITVIPWTISAQQGSTISQKKNRILILHLISGTKSTQLLCCMREMSDQTYGNTCYSSGTVYLLQGDELELVIPDRPGVLISTDPESTFFGVIQLN
uniref:Tumor necrosis factor ligand superfamily member 13B-like n=1 Tax=Acanthochromis polyacanthus TaxID=80966 RepID=A0A3Q1GFC9_9TELE